MKKLLFVALIAFYSAATFGTTVIITNSGFTFSPDSISIHAGDTVKFQVNSFHVPIEVSQATWNANGNTPLPGFSLPGGGGIVAGLTVGVHYYVCQPHASMGMKGRIFVTPATGINSPSSNINKVTIYPNPAIGKFNVIYQSGNAGNGKNITIDIEVYNLLGEKIYFAPDFKWQTNSQIDLSFVPAGIYFVKIYDRDKSYVRRVVLQ